MQQLHFYYSCCQTITTLREIWFKCADFEPIHESQVEPNRTGMLQILTDNQLLMSSERFPKVNSSTSIKTRFHCFDCTDNKLLSDWAQFPSLHPFFLLSVLPATPALPDITTLTWWNREQRRRGDHQAWLTMIASLGGKKPKNQFPWKPKCGQVLSQENLQVWRGLIAHWEGD